MSAPSFYRRPLPESQVPFASAEGRQLFREALAAGTMEGYFAQAEQLHTQQEPAFCGLATLVVALNALAIDPGRLWKGPWRWYSEELLDCCAPLERVKREGITFDQFACLARCNGAAAQATRAEGMSVEAFRAAIEAAVGAAEGEVLAISYSRRVLGQTGEGHFSTIAGFHRARDLALVLDVARFKYPPHWVPVPLLFQAMLPHDEATGRSRGWVTLRHGKYPPLAYRLSPHSSTWPEIARAFEGLGDQLRSAGSVDAALAQFFALLPPALSSLVQEHDVDSPEHRAIVCSVTDELRASAIGSAIRRVRGHDDDMSTVLALLAPDATFEGVPGMAELRALGNLPGAVAAEVSRLREQLSIMTHMPNL